jgi:hypothetical protein
MTGGGFWGEVEEAKEEEEDDDDDDDVEDGVEVEGEGEGTLKRALKRGLFRGTGPVAGIPPLELEPVEDVVVTGVVEVEKGKFEDAEEEVEGVDGLVGVGVVVVKGVTPPPSLILFCIADIA